MFAAFTDYQDFNHIVGVTNVGELNDAVAAGKSADLINVAEALHNNRINAITDQIVGRFRDGGAKIDHPTMAEEGFGLTLVEALSCGVPCVAFDEGAMREIIINGENGFISTEMTTDGLAKAIEKVYLMWKNNYEGYIEMCKYSNDAGQNADAMRRQA